MGREILQEAEIIQHGLFVGRELVFAEVDAQNYIRPARPASEGKLKRADFSRGLQLLSHKRRAAAGKAHAVDDRFVFGQAEHARLRIPALRHRRHRADLDVAEAQRAQSPHRQRVLVIARREANGILKGQAEGSDRFGRGFANGFEKPERGGNVLRAA